MVGGRRSSGTTTKRSTTGTVWGGGNCWDERDNRDATDESMISTDVECTEEIMVEEEDNSILHYNCTEDVDLLDEIDTSQINL